MAQGYVAGKKKGESGYSVGSVRRLVSPSQRSSSPCELTAVPPKLVCEN